LTLDGFETGAPDRQSQGRRGRAHSSLSSSPPARGRPTCRIQEPVRAASRGGPIEGEHPHPRSLANGTEPHLANPRKRFHGQVSGPRANPYRTGHVRPLELPDNSSTRNPQSATRSMGVAETPPSVLRRDGEGAYKYIACSCRASGARPAGPLTRPHGTALATRREECPISKHQHLRDPNGYTRRCSGATVGDSHEGPLNN
jgi:hypothetical protein